MQDLVYNPGLSLLELVSVESAKRLNLFVKNISEQVRKEIKNPKLRSILEFPVLFLGAKPNKTLVMVGRKFRPFFMLSFKNLVGISSSKND